MSPVGAGLLGCPVACANICSEGLLFNLRGVVVVFVVAAVVSLVVVALVVAVLVVVALVVVMVVAVVFFLVAALLMAWWWRRRFCGFGAAFLGRMCFKSAPQEFLRRASPGCLGHRISLSKCMVILAGVRPPLFA